MAIVFALVLLVAEGWCYGEFFVKIFCMGKMLFFRG